MGDAVRSGNQLSCQNFLTARFGTLPGLFSVYTLYQQQQNNQKFKNQLD